MTRWPGLRSSRQWKPNRRTGWFFLIENPLLGMPSIHKRFLCIGACVCPSKNLPQRRVYTTPAVGFVYRSPVSGWWRELVYTQIRPLSLPPPSSLVYTQASGGRCVCKNAVSQFVYTQKASEIEAFVYTPRNGACIHVVHTLRRLVCIHNSRPLHRSGGEETQRQL